VTDTPHDKLEAAVAIARTKWLQAFLRRELPLLGDSPESWKAWDARLKRELEDRGKTTLTQQSDRVSEATRAIRTLYGDDHPSVKGEYVGFTRAQWLEYNLAITGGLETRKLKLLKDPDAIADTARSLLTADTAPEVAAGLAVVTGRRHAETIKTARFRLESDWSVWFAGQLKWRGERRDTEFEIPTLAPAAEVVAAWKRLRSLAPETASMSHTQVNAAFADKVAQVCHDRFESLVPARLSKAKLSTHLARSIFATIAAHWFCPPEIPDLDFRNYIQGHFDLWEMDGTVRVNALSERNYHDYAIADASGTNIDGRLGIRLGEPGVVPIEYARDRLATLRRLELAPVSPMSPNQPTIRLSARHVPQFESLRDRLGVGQRNNREVFDVLLALADLALNALHSRGIDHQDPSAVAAFFNGASHGDQSHSLGAIASSLGLPDDADEENVLNAISNLQEQHERDSIRLEQFEALQEQVTAATRQLDKMQARFNQANGQESQALAAIASALGLDAGAGTEQILAALQQRQEQPAEVAGTSVPDSALDRLSSTVMMFGGKISQLDDRLSGLQERQEATDRWFQQYGPGIQMMAAMASAMQGGSPMPAATAAAHAPTPPAPTAPTATAAPTPTPPAPAAPMAAATYAPQPTPPARRGRSRPPVGSDAVRALVPALMEYNETRDTPRERFFISSGLVIKLIDVSRNAADAIVAAELDNTLQDHHARLRLNHTANRNKPLAPLKHWLQARPELQDLPWL